MTTLRSLTALAAAAVAMSGPPAVAADEPKLPPGIAQAQSGPKQYDRNAATGDYARALRDLPTSSLAGTTSPPAPAAPAADGGFDWGAAGIGACLAFAGTVGAAALRRRVQVSTR